MSDEYKAYCLKIEIIQELAATNTPQQIRVSMPGERCAEWFDACSLTVDFLHFCGERS